MRWSLVTSTAEKLEAWGLTLAEKTLCSRWGVRVEAASHFETRQRANGHSWVPGVSRSYFQPKGKTDLGTSRRSESIAGVVSRRKGDHSKHVALAGS